MLSRMYAGVDVGTSGCKMLVYDSEGDIVYRAARSYEEIGERGHRELNPETVRENLMDMFCEVGRKCGGKISALSVASLGESIVCLGKEEQILANSMVTGDIRGKDQVKELIEKIGEEKIFRITGLPPNELYGLPKYMWLNQDSDVIRDAKYILFYEDYVNYILTGKRMISFTSAARSLAFDFQRKKWSEELLDFAGITVNQLSQPVPPLTVIGNILPEIAAKTGLDPHMKVIAGGHDQTCAALGAGLRNLQDSECSMGTCEFMFFRMPEPSINTYMMENDFTCIPYILENSYLTSLEVTTCGVLKKWARNTIFTGIDLKCKEEGKDFYDYMDNLAKDNVTNIMILPQFGSSGNPDLNMNTVGTITGLTIHTKPGELYRAILESFSLQMRYSYERLKNLGVNADRIIVTGGGARSDLTPQIRADVFNMDVISLERDEAGTLGCAIMASVANKEFETIEDAIEKMVKYQKVYKPDKKMVDYYNDKFVKFKILYEKMHEEN